MLIYNHKKEFLGIDEEDLKTLGLSNLVDLYTEAAEFADLFVKTPGFIHNFKHVHWIDYITCSDNAAEAKAIIRVKGKNYSSGIEIKTIYLVDNPSQKAYIVNLLGIKLLSNEQSEKISADILNKPVPKTVSPSTKLAESAPAYDRLSPNIIKDVYEDTTFDIEKKSIPQAPIAKPVIEKVEEPKAAPIVEIEKISKEKEKTEEAPFSSYIYDPRVASHDLGLPIDLVEEFIQDFIAQANSFKEKLYEYAINGNLSSLKSQSHKLKGVAANLRVEDALDALTIINTSNDNNEIKTNLDRLYRIIDKLSRKDVVAAEPIIAKKETQKSEDEFVLSFKNDKLAQDVPIMKIDDSEVPDSIEIPELADDEFLKPKITINEIDVNDEDLSVLDNSADDIEESAQEIVQEKIPDLVMNYNKKQIAHDIGLDIDSFNELFEDYLIEAKDLSKSMSIAVEKNDLKECKDIAIKLKGMSENMRIHDFDNALEAIINSTDAASAESFVKNITLKLNLISKAEDK
ncbi:MAG: Hpt domain-containing protein [Sulfurimonas sp.]|uniref:Hpt domain-containing protein n=1 Tax=Sulfurimonas sp. TaxID=2022749 RepID=UPI00260FA401|nr:Hpt domain-containing protein [Sulfurimonas sp.]MDD5400787.1 Hpt domain-containing protein [Sulfurimonas sp.]